MKVTAYIESEKFERRALAETEIDIEKVGYMNDYPRGVKGKELTEYLEKTYGTRYSIFCNGMVGTGKKVHRVRAYGYLDNGTFRVTSAYCGCGSQRWNRGGGFSGIRIMSDPTAELSTCKKCRR